MGEARALLASYCENHSSLEALGSVDISFLLKEMEGNWQKCTHLIQQRITYYLLGAMCFQVIREALT